MTKSDLPLLDHFFVTVGVGAMGDNQRILWEHFSAWDYAQTNDRAVWENDPHTDDLAEAAALINDDPNAGFKRFLALAEAGSIWAMAWVGYCFYLGHGVARDAGRAEHWYRRSCEAGCTRAILDLGRVLARRGDFAGAADVFSQGVADDWAPALFWAAQYRLKRPTTRKSREEARALLERAVAKGSPAAQFVLELSLARGRFGVREIPRGLRLLWASTDARFAIIEKRRAESAQPKSAPTGEGVTSGCGRDPLHPLP